MNFLKITDVVGLQALLDHANQKTIGIVGRNGSGKSTLVHALQAQYSKKIVIAWQDGFQASSLIKVKDLFELLKLQDSKVVELETLNFFALEWAGLKEIWEREINVLSGGENQLLKILSVACLASELYVFDEPSSFLDDEKQELLKKLFYYLKSKNKSLLIIEHDRELLKEICDKIYQLKNNCLEAVFNP